MGDATDRTDQTPCEQGPGAVGDPAPTEKTVPLEHPSKTGLPWRLVALVAGASMALGGAAAYVITLAATHDEAVRVSRIAGIP